MRLAENRNKSKIFLILTAVVIAVLIGFLVYKNWEASEQAGPTATAGPRPVFAAKGELVSGFPKELVLDEKARVDNSYAINYAANLNQYTASWKSGEAMASLFEKYKDYFAKNSWTITNEILQYRTSRGLYATEDSNEASVAIMDRGTNREVIVSYVKK